MKDIPRAKFLEFIAWLQEEYTNNHAEADATGIFSGSYWSGKADMCDEVLEYLDRMDNIPCQHESDGYPYINELNLCKCFKCGEFYR